MAAHVAQNAYKMALKSNDERAVDVVVSFEGSPNRDKYLPAPHNEGHPIRTLPVSYSNCSNYLSELQRTLEQYLVLLAQSSKKESLQHPTKDSELNCIRTNVQSNESLLISDPSLELHNDQSQETLSPWNKYDKQPHATSEESGSITTRKHQLSGCGGSLLLILFLSLNYATSSCSCSHPTEHNYNTGLVRPRDFLTNQQSPPSFAPEQQHQITEWSHPFKRHLDDISSNSRLSSLFRSFSLDQSSPSPSQSHSWTSMLTNPFGLPKQDTLDNHIKNILVPRVSGTPGNVQVREYIINQLRGNNYEIELDEFTGSTPIGEVKFANIIASSNPKACRQLVLACHYDSKMMDGFLGAIDSAVPCAMLLRMSETFNKSFRPSGNDNGDTDDATSDGSLGLKFIFFDGEEAFVQWSSTDSLYGSRHLASKWAKQQAPTECQRKQQSAGGSATKNELSRIELFVLLDLIGATDTSFVMYNLRLRNHYEALQKYEKSYLARAGLGQSQARRETAFKGRVVPLDFVEDDHVPFKKRGVPILLLLAHPFPKVWHTVEDNYDAIDFPRTRRILHTLEEFVANYQKHN